MALDRLLERFQELRALRELRDELAQTILDQNYTDQLAIERSIIDQGQPARAPSTPNAPEIKTESSITPESINSKLKQIGIFPTEKDTFLATQTPDSLKAIDKMIIDLGSHLTPKIWTFITSEPIEINRLATLFSGLALLPDMLSTNITKLLNCSKDELHYLHYVISNKDTLLKRPKELTFLDPPVDEKTGLKNLILRHFDAFVEMRKIGLPCSFFKVAIVVKESSSANRPTIAPHNH